MLFLQRELDRYGDCKMPFALVIFEIWHKNEGMSNEKLQKVASSFRAIAASYDIIGHYRDFEFAMLLPLKGENECREFVEIFQKFVADTIDPSDSNLDSIKMMSGIVIADSDFDEALEYETFVRAAVQAKQANKQRHSLCTSNRQLRWDELKKQAESQNNSDDQEALTALWKKLYDESMHLQFDKAYWTQAAQKYAEQLVKSGRYVQVVPILSDLLCFHTDQLGPDNLITIGTAGELAHCYYAQGKYADAEWLSQGVLNAYSKHYGSEYPIVATWHYNLGSLYYVQQKYSAAEPHYKKALEIRNRILGATHADTRKSQASYDALLKVMNPLPANKAEADREVQLITGSWTVYKPENDQSIT
jgi:GGDEF domain-containing protein